MATQPKLKLRYEVGEVLGQGGMGVVYKAHDTVLDRDVALKTLRNSADNSALQLFQKECQVLASISHPNIVEIFDIGELLEDDKHIPFFVMPLLPGVGLDRLIRESSVRLTVERSVEIFSQSCRGLHAAHEHGLVHRDLKPSNLFVMNDDSVKIIDFGVALMVDSRATRGIKGTLLYMAPEQIEMKPLSALSDIFSLGVVCYETLTGRRPFERPTEGEVAQAILHDVPQPVSELNPAVNTELSRVIHKAMAKQPWHRFASAHEFADALQKAARGEALEIFDTAKIQPRIQRVRKALEQSDLQFAAEILDEIEAEGHVDPEISQLRRELDRSQRQKTVRQLVESARTRFEEDEYPLALQKIEEALQLDPGNASALGLKSTIESRRSERKIDDWFRLAHQHISNHGYPHAREAIKNVLALRPKNRRALQLLAEVDRREREYLALREEKEVGYKAALDAWHNGEISSALSKMNAVLDLVHRSPDSVSPDRSAVYQNFYNQVRSEFDAMNHAHAEARKRLAERNFTAALTLCESYLAKFPDNTLFRALKFDIDEQQRQSVSAFIAEVDRGVESEPDLSRRVTLLEDALTRYPGEPHFEQALGLVRQKRELVNSIVAKSRFYEEHGQFSEALGQWEILRTIYPQYPGLEFESERVVKRLEQQSRTNMKANWVSRIEDQLRANLPDRALELSAEALREFPGDGELLEIEKACRQGIERAGQVQSLLAEAAAHATQGRVTERIGVLRQAALLSPADPEVRATLLEALNEQARALLETDWQAAEELTNEALAVEPDNALAKSLNVLAQDRKRNQLVDGCLSRARQLQTAGDMAKARAEIEQGLAAYPEEPRLKQRHAALTEQTRTETLPREERKARLAEPTVPTATLGTGRPKTPGMPTSGPRPTVPSRRTPPVASAQAVRSATPRRELPAANPTLQKRAARLAPPRWVLPAAGALLVVALAAALLLWHFSRATKVARKAASQPTVAVASQPAQPTQAAAAATAVAPATAPATPAPVPPSTAPSPAKASPAAAKPPSTKPRPALPKHRVVRARPHERAPSAAATGQVEEPLPVLPKQVPPASPAVPPATKKPQPKPASPVAASPVRPEKPVLDARHRAIQIAGLSALAYQADIHKNYFAPSGANAVSYAQQILKLDPKNAYAQKLIRFSVAEGKKQVEKDIDHKNLRQAQQACTVMLQLLPAQPDLVALQHEVSALVGFHVRYLEASPAGAFALGTLKVAAKHVNFAVSAAGGQSTGVEIPCSHVRDYKAGTTIASSQPGFELQTQGRNYDFVPQDMSATAALNAVKSACAQQSRFRIHF